MSARLTEPASSQCTFSNVTEKSVARKKKPVKRSRVSAPPPPGRPRNPPRGCGARAVAATPPRAASRPAGRRASAPSSSASAARIPSTSSGAATTPAPGLPDQLGGRAVGRHDGEDRPLRREVLEHLAREHALAAPGRVGDQQEQRLGVALELQRLAPRRVRKQAEPVAESEPLGPGAVGRAEVAEEARLDVQAGLGERGQERARIALAEEAAGVRDPEALARPVLEPLEVVEVRSVRDRHHRPLRPQPARLVGDRVGDRDDPVGAPRDQPGDALRRPLLRAHEPALGPPVRVRDERVAQVGHPGRLARPLRDRPDQVHRSGRRGRDHHVDPLAVDESDRGPVRGQVPGHVLVRHEQAAAERAGMHEPAANPRRAVQLLREPGASGPEVAGPVHDRVRRQREVLVAVEPARVVGREHVCLDPELGQVRGELERPLHASAAGRREVHRHEQHLHRARDGRGRTDRPPRRGACRSRASTVSGSRPATRRRSGT